MLARRTHLALLWSVPLGVLVQGALAGQAWFIDADLFGLHGGVGHGVLTLAIAATALAWLSPTGTLVRWGAASVVALLIAQTGLGYAGHRSGLAAASALHIPLGLTVFGLAVATAVVALLSPAPQDPVRGEDPER